MFHEWRHNLNPLRIWIHFLNCDWTVSHTLFLLLCRLMSLAMRLRAFWLMKFNLQSFLLYFPSVCSASQIWCDTNFSILERIREKEKNCKENNGNESNLTFSVGRGCFLLFFIISQDKTWKTEERHQTREI